MKIGFVSDLHVDHNGNLGITEDIEADILVVAGDVSNSASKTAHALNQLSDMFDKVLFVDGNHEHYKNNFYDSKIDTIENNNNYLKSLLNDNIIKLDENTIYETESLRFIGVNGWYSFDYFDYLPGENIDFWKNYMNDYLCIYKRGSVHQPLPYKLAENHSNYIRSMINSTDDLKKNIVVTHTLPHHDLLIKKPWDHIWERAGGFYLNKYNESVLEDLGHKISLWHNGHTHKTQDLMIHDVRCICNPRGYPGENIRWTPLVIEESEI